MSHHWLCLEEGLEVVLSFLIARSVDSLCVLNMREDQESFGNQLFNVIFLPEAEAGGGILSTMYNLHSLHT